MNSILKCSQRNGRARAVFWRGNDAVLQNVSLHFVGFFQNGEKASAGIMRKSNARTLVVEHE